MKRKTFIKNTAMASLGVAPLVSLVNCSDNNPEPDPDDKGCLANGTEVIIANNHSHEIIVSKDDVAAGTEKMYDIQGSSGHSHDVTVSAGDFAKLKINQSVQVTSTTGDSHTHIITISCA